MQEGKRMNSKLVILSGPSCVGKGPLLSALRRIHPEIRFVQPVLCHSRPPRKKRHSGEFEVHGVDYYFLPRGMLEGIDRTRFAVVHIRSQIQAVDLVELGELVKKHDLVIAEAYPTLAAKIVKWAKSLERPELDIRTIFLSPLSDEEIEEAAKREGITPEQVVTETMTLKLEKRGEDSPESIRERAASAFWEMRHAVEYTDRIVNHAGEDALDQWSDPLGPEANRVLEEFVRVLKGDRCDDND